jgi:hypothetical protein
MIPKRSWATLVADTIYEHLRDTPDAPTIEIPIIEWAGNTPAIGETIYLIKQKTSDKFKDAGIFCAAILEGVNEGTISLILNK